MWSWTCIWELGAGGTELGAGSWELGAELGEPLESWGNRAGPPAIPGSKILNKNPLKIPKGIPG